MDSFFRGLTEADVKIGFVKEWLWSCLPSVISFTISVILAIIVAFIGMWIIKGIRKLVRKKMEKYSVATGVIQFVDKTLLVLGIILLILLILGMFGITTSSIAATIASIGVTAGFAFQGSLSNFAGGILILLLHPFKVGDYIVEDSKGKEGTVVEISIFYTKILTADEKLVVVPNGTLANTSLTNLTHDAKRMINTKFCISYEDDIRMAKQVIEEVAKQIPTRIDGEEIKVFVDELGDNSVVLGARVFVETDTYIDSLWQFREDVKYALDEHGITIPYNQLDVHVMK